MAPPLPAFVDALEHCIRNASHIVSRTVPVWADHCESPGDKTAYQAQQLDPVLTPLFTTHGYTAALWCAIYTGGWPMGWTDDNWYDNFLCPEATGKRFCNPNAELTIAEGLGDPVTGQGGPEVPIHAMSCALCQRLERNFGKAPYNQKTSPIPGPGHADERFKGMAESWEERLGNRGYWDRWPVWDMHAFGLWFAGVRWPSQLDYATLHADIKQVGGHAPRLAPRTPPAFARTPRSHRCRSPSSG